MRKCSSCGEIGHDRRSCITGSTRKRLRREFDPWLDLEWREHTEAQKVVDEHPDGMTLEQVGDVLGITRERVRQIEVIALQKLRSGIGLDDFVEVKGAAFAVIECTRCSELFLRQGRNIYCEECAPKIKRGRTNVIRLHDHMFKQAAHGMPQTKLESEEFEEKMDPAVALLIEIMNA